MADQKQPAELLPLVSDIVAAHLSNNTVPVTELPNLIREVYRALANVGSDTAESERPEPAVPVKKSVFPDFIVCLEDGKKFKSLKRHLRTRYSMTPDEYRTKWGLPHDYPMVAPNYAKERSTLAKRMGLGTSRKGA
jgi:predicted transcriptional regulator